MQSPAAGDSISLQRHCPRKLVHPFSFFMVIGFNHDFILIEIKGIGPHLLSIPGRIVHIQQFPVVVVHLIGKGGLGRRRVGMAGHPQFHLGIDKEKQNEIS